ncbi:uncharacterized protein LOC130046666 isoform X1 [Ostrea edulis]|uniref:uncharacterized protein LOC130046666 isoform X1 n=1 Tax=Ostrea edulis TaxID=37623 RepID=UPI0024AF4919|nr:uncharacterized protein LOC130046666 isoform X1 [Ostrea edulis]XP_056003383.1 uncharacterized protein LOC130046666 isoform X1 [Ostrea edulis]
MKRMLERIIFLFFSLPGIWTPLIKTDEFEQGWCHEQQRELEIETKCEINVLYISVTSDPTQSDDNYLVQCFQTKCINGIYNEMTQILTFNMTFIHTMHAGKYLLVEINCSDGTEKNESYLLKPCVSGFRAHAVHNDTHIKVSCEHDSFNYSSTGMIIKGEENSYATCLRSTTTLTIWCTPGATALANGVEYTLQYTPGMVLMCELDGQVINVTVEQHTSKSPSTRNTGKTGASTSSSTGRTGETGASTSPTTGSTGKTAGKMSCSNTNQICFLIHIVSIILYHIVKI